MWFSGARVGQTDPHQSLPAHRICLDQHPQAPRAARSQAPSRRRDPGRPVPPVLVTLLRQHLQNYGTTADRRLFHGVRGGMISESVYGRAWHTARRDALGPVLAATPLARRPYDLRHTALSLWLTATGAPAEIAARAGNSVTVLHTLHSPVRAENLIHGSDQHSCSSGALTVMLTGHVPAVRFPSDHATSCVAAAVPARGGVEDRRNLDPAPPARSPAAAAAAPPEAELGGPGRALSVMAAAKIRRFCMPTE